MRSPSLATLPQPPARSAALLIQRQTAGPSMGGGMAPPIVNHVLSQTGSLLDNRARASMQNRIGHDFSQVRIHTGDRAAASASSVNALAYTAGNHIVFGQDRYRPGTPSGDRLLAHELTHTIQQSGRSPYSELRLGDPGDSFESEAESVSQTEAPASRQRSAPVSIQRQTAPPAAAGATPAGTRPQDFGISLNVVDNGASGAAGAARERLNEIYLRLNPQNLRQLQSDGITAIEMQIIPRDRKLTDLPVFATLRGTRTPDGRLWDNVRGVGGQREGNKIVYGVAEEELLGNRSHAGAIALGILGGVLGGAAGVGLGMLLGGIGGDAGRGDRQIGGAIAGGVVLGAAGIAGGIAAGNAIDDTSGYGEGHVAVHETGHTVELFSLTAAQHTEVQRLFDARTAAGGPWLPPEDYTSSNLHEYFAQCTSAFLRAPSAPAYRDVFTPQWLQRNDPGMFRLLTTLYGARGSGASGEPERAQRAAAA